MKRDKRIREWAELYKKQHYLVHANMEGSGKPNVISGHVPDIMASKVLQKVIIQVETHHSEDSEDARRRRQAFREWAEKDPNRKFLTDVV